MSAWGILFLSLTAVFMGIFCLWGWGYSLYYNDGESPGDYRFLGTVFTLGGVIGLANVLPDLIPRLIGEIFYHFVAAIYLIS